MQWLLVFLIVAYDVIVEVYYGVVAVQILRYNSVGTALCLLWLRMWHILAAPADVTSTRGFDFEDHIVVWAVVISDRSALVGDWRWAHIAGRDVGAEQSHLTLLIRSMNGARTGQQHRLREVILLSHLDL